jgi:NDP-sugar pyrophosphorylase family protein
MSLPVAILAGGLGTRLGEITRSIPKALVSINGEPFLGHQLRLLQRAGIRDVILCISYLGEQIQAYVEDGADFGLRVQYSLDGPTLRGTAGAIRQALPLLGSAFFVIYGDSYLTCDYTGVDRVFKASGKEALMTVYRNEGLWDASNVEFFEGRILAYDKKNKTPRMRHIDYGLGAFQASVFTSLPEEGVHDLAQVYQSALLRNQLAACEIPDRFYEIGSPEGVQSLSDYLLTQ